MWFYCYTIKKALTVSNCPVSFLIISVKASYNLVLDEQVFLFNTEEHKNNVRKFTFCADIIAMDMILCAWKILPSV